MKRSLQKLMLLCLLAVGSAAAQVKSVDELPWQVGPTKGDLGNNATIVVPDGYAFLQPDGVREFNKLSQNPDPGMAQYLLAKNDLSWIAFFSFDKIGYVKDNEKLDAADLLKSITEGTEAANEERRANGWSPMHVTGWAFSPQYDKDIQSLEWAIRGKSEDSPNEIINYNTKLLGRRGVMSVTLVTDPTLLNSSVADFKRQLEGYDYKSGERYADFEPGDHVAEYGLAALVTGGAAAVAAKKGFFAAIAVFLLKMWKLALVGLVAVGAGIKKLFSGKQKDSQS